jgi:hypothetical protein
VSDDRAYPAHARDAIDAILEYTLDGRDAFFADRRIQDAVLRNLEVLGQAVKELPGLGKRIEDLGRSEGAGAAKLEPTARPSEPDLLDVGISRWLWPVPEPRRLR